MKQSAPFFTFHSSLFTLLLLLCLSAKSQTAITVGADTLRSNDIRITTTHTFINGGKLNTQTVDAIEVGGKWISRPQYFMYHAGKGNAAEIVTTPLDLAPRDYLIKAGKQGQSAIFVVLLSGLAAALIPDDAGLFIAGAGGVTALVLSISAWGNIRKAGEAMPIK